MSGIPEPTTEEASYAWSKGGIHLLVNFKCWQLPGGWEGLNLTVKPIIDAPLSKNFFLENWGNYLDAEARMLLSSVGPITTMTPKF